MDYVYFIERLPNCESVAFGRTRNLGDRWSKYRNTCPDPQLLGLIQCETVAKMNKLERHIKHQHLNLFIFHHEWLHHTPEVRAFYQERTNVDIEKSLSDAIETYKATQSKAKRRWTEQQREQAKEYRQERWQDPAYRERMNKQQRERYQNDLEYRERRREYQREYRQQHAQCYFSEAVKTSR